MLSYISLHLPLNLPNFRQSRVTPRPILLRPDNFTRPQRTPWGGTRLLREFKADALGTASPPAIVGESWELSATPELPSATLYGESLGALLARDPVAMLGAEARLGRTSTGLLVKWLDAAEDLSLQIHPADDYRGLAPDQSGKPECWYVVAHAPGAGLYLGFQPGTDEARVRAVLEAGDDLSACMVFVPVARGDVIAVEPGMPHAIGRGVTLIEPQVVLPARRGVTYRYWDWNRRYDADGRPDAGGKPRALDLEHALAVTDWAQATDPTTLARCRAAGGWPAEDTNARVEPLCGPEPESPVRSPHLRMARALGDGQVHLPDWDVLRALTVVEGSLTLLGPGFELPLNRGHTAAVPAVCGALRIRLAQAHAVIAGLAL